MRSGIIRPYWPLIKSILIPVGVMKMVLSIIAILFILIAVVGWLWKGDVVATVSLLSAIVILYFFIIAIILPHQAMTIISSKSLRYLIDFRKFYFLSVFLFSLILSCFSVLIIFYRVQTQGECVEEMCAGLKGIDSWQYLCHQALQFSVLISVYVISLFVLTYRFPLLQCMVFCTFGAISPVLNELSQWNFLQLIGALVFGWSAFAFWWLRLNPKKYHTNIYAQTMRQLTSKEYFQINSNFQFSFLISTSKPRTFFGTMLMGVSDSYDSMIRMFLFSSTAAILMFPLFRFLMGDKFHGFIGSSGAFFISLIFVSGCSGMALGLCRNIKRLWLLSSGSRYEFLIKIERHWIQYSLMLSLMLPLTYAASIYIAGFQYLTADHFLLLALIAYLDIMGFFYLSLWIYSRNQDAKLGFGLVQTLVMMAQMLLLAAINFILIKSAYIALGCISVFLLIVIIVVRRQLFRKWKHINFVRVS